MSQRFDPTQLREGDPVRITYKQGNYRFIKYYDETNAVIVGPIGGTGEGERVIKITSLRQPPSDVTRERVAINPMVIQISETAKQKRRR